jgi:magnesium transporter
MLRVLRSGRASLDTPRIGDGGPAWALPEDTVWLDLLNPTRAEELAVEAAVGVPLPTREEMAEIEMSSRLYQEAGATYMTTVILAYADGDSPQTGPVTFVLAGPRLVTIRYIEPKSFALFIAQIARQPSLCATGASTFLGLIEAVVDRMADILERTGAEVENSSQKIFQRPRGDGFESILTRLGRSQIVNAKVRDSLVGLARLISFAMLADQMERDGEARGRLRSLQRDVASLTDHDSYLSSHITFLLDAALGMINIEQNAIIKIFSIGAVCLMPPTLVASVYGMNFKHMPELSWTFGYPLAIGLMIAAGVTPLWWFRRKGWL